jgi:LemA protein
LSASKILLIVIGIIVVVALIAGMTIPGTYNSLVRLNEETQSAWGQVQVQYQRRNDLILNLVETVKGAANFEQSTLTAVTEARAKVGQVTPQAVENITNNPAALQKYQEAQAGMASALSRLMVVVEKYPELKATQAFRDLQFQLDQTENRVGTERRRYNEAAQAFNTKRDSFPTVLIAGFFGSKFQPKAYFQSTPGADKPPEVKF